MFRHREEAWYDFRFNAFRCFASETRQFDKPTVRGRVQPARLRGSEVREVSATTIGAETALP